MNENVVKILSDIKGGNDRGEKITLIGATKTMPCDVINDAILSGLTVVAENRVQEFREKTDLLLPCRQDFIGRLQTNKVKYLVGKVFLIHSVDNLKLAEEINRVAEKRQVVQKILLEINVSGEITKGGFDGNGLFPAAQKIRALKNLEIKGLMTMMPRSEDKEYLADLFEKARFLYDTLKKDFPSCDTLSMGMSEDYETAIKHGSNAIRLGTALFGKRDYTVKEKE